MSLDKIDPGIYGTVDEKIITLKHSSLTSASEGKLVKISDNMTVALCDDDDAVHGVIVKVEKDVCSVKIGGVVQVGYDGTLAVGHAYIAAKSNTEIKVVKAAVASDEATIDKQTVLVVSVDSTNTKAVIII